MTDDPNGPVAAAARAAPMQWLQRQGAFILLLLALTALAVAVSESLVAGVRARSDSEARARAEVAAGVAQQVVIRRIEAADVLHRLAQAWFTLRERGNIEGAAALEDHIAATANSGSFGFVQVALIGADGWMDWSSISRRESRVYLGDREHFLVHARGMQDMFVSAPVLGRVSNRWTIQLTKPMRDEAGRFGGVVVVSLDLYSLSEALSELTPTPGDAALLLRGETTIAAHSETPQASIGQDLATSDPLRRLIPTRPTGSFTRRDEGRVESFVGWRRLPGTNLAVVAMLDGNAVEGAVSTLITSTRMVAFAVVLAVLAGGIVLILARERRAARQEVDRVEAERRLSDEAHRLFERRVAALPAVVFGGRVDLEGGFTLTHVSESLERITGWRRDQLGDRQPWAHLAEDMPVEDHGAFKRQAVANGQGTREFRARRPDGTVVMLREHLRVVEAMPDGSTEVVGYLRDITAERDIELKAQAAGRLATLGEMAAGLAHELNQPLAVMSLAADNAARALQRRGVDALPEVLQRLDRIGVQGRRARDIVDHLRVFGRPQEEGDPEPVSLADAVEGAMVLTRAALREAAIEVTIDLPADLPPVMGRLIAFEQAIVNLLLNARDAIHDHAKEPGSIRIVGRVEEPGVVLRIIDNGGGIPEAVMYRLFEPFFTTKPPGKGTGLGLPICHAAMRAVGGDIEAANLDGGACFTLRFRPAA
ncbi:PAS domain S-box protein [Roseomonas sp. PWR1]|uniref:histidine kinase n=1 Tax=Roseomonas nitratireducens TaxID=2820810 RepID=A0ABS4AS92_9PROT|nr:ATP-binding protein [Neoroseomonas nitratireducens]MBP0464221.1 PAS domain S-box protein [Neoroseomonas nitratireducens]